MPEEGTFFDALRKAGFEVKLKEYKFYGGAIKGDWDVGISLSTNGRSRQRLSVLH